MMIDIETMALTPDALVLSIGAIAFDIHEAAPSFGDEFIRVPNFMDQVLMRRRIDPDTQKFWAEQTPEAQSHWRDCVGTVHPKLACLALQGFIEEQQPEFIWAKGPQFDIVVLEHLFQQCSMQAPWKYSRIRDVRTACAILPPNARRPATSGMAVVPHHPVSDCREQVRALWECGLWA